MKIFYALVALCFYSTSVFADALPAVSAGDQSFENSFSGLASLLVTVPMGQFSSDHHVFIVSDFKADPKTTLCPIYQSSYAGLTTQPTLVVDRKIVDCSVS